LANGLRGEAVSAQQFATEAFFLLGKADKKMLWADVGMAEFAGGAEGIAEGTLDARGDANLGALFGFGVAAGGFLLDLLPQFVGRYLELSQSRPNDLAVRKC